MNAFLSLFFHIGKYYILITRAFRKPEKPAIYRRRILDEIDSLGINSLGIVVIITVFMGAVITIQGSFGFSSAWVPVYAVGLATRDSIVLEFAPTIVSLILAGKVGSNITSEIGTMRVTEQIDALEIMGINSAGFLIMPKIVAAVIINPFLIIIGMFMGVFGGWVFGVMTGVISSVDYIYGIQYQFVASNVSYALIKASVFAFLITSVSAYQGYYTKGGALEVGKASTRAVVYSSILILIFNFIITQMLLA